MILEKQIENIVIEEGDSQESIEMSLDLDSAQILMQMLSKNLYQDHIGSCCREVCSNSLDSLRRSGNTDPIIVSFKANKDGNYEFSSEDFGTGMDDKDVREIISKYGKSTKRLEVNSLGHWGIGFKSPLAYSSTFYFICRKDGMERKYMMYEGEYNNTIDLLYEKPTDSKNGVKVIIPVKWGDFNTFVRKIKEQLAYFENVYFDCENVVPNNHKITRSEHFQYSQLTINKEMHITLDDVYYPIDFEKLGIDRIEFPVALRFSLTDGLNPTINRESLQYTKEAIAIINAKIKKVATYFVETYNQAIKDTDSLSVIIDYHRGSSKNIPHFSGNGVMDVRNLAPYTTVKFIAPKLNCLKHLDTRKVYELKDYFYQNHKDVKYTYSYSGRFYNCDQKDAWRHKLNYDSVARNDRRIYVFTELSKLKKLYLKDIMGSKEAWFVKVSKNIKLGNTKSRYTGQGFETYMRLLDLHKHPKSLWREIIKEWQHIVSLATTSFIDADKIEIPAEWTEARKKQRLQLMAQKGTNKRKKKMVGEVIGKVAASLERYVSGKNCKFVPITINMASASMGKKITLYGGTDQEDLMQKLFSVILSDKVRIVMFSDRELKNLKEIDLHNWIEISKFMTGKHKTYKRIITAYLINELMLKYHNVFRRLSYLKEISTVLGDKVDRLSKYKDGYYVDGDKELFKAMLKVADEHKLYDTSVYDVYKEVVFVFEKLPFIETMFSKMSYSKEEQLLKAIRDLFKYYKQRIDWKHYNLPVNEEPIDLAVKEELEELEKLELVVEEIIELEEPAF